MQDFLIHYKLLAVALASFIECDATMLLAGVIAHMGIFSLSAAISAGTIGMLGGDVAWYLLGRNRSLMIRQSRIYARAGTHAEKLFARFGVWQLFAMRIVFGTRIATLTLCGVRGMSLGKFILYDGLSCAVWAILLASLGCGLSLSAAQLTGSVKSIEMWIGVIVFTSLMLILTGRALLQRFRSSAQS